MKKVIVTTTINPPTKAINLYDHLKDWTLVVIGDKKTPANYRLDNGIYISAEQQEHMDKALSDAIGWNCIQRRNFGLLKALEMNADIVAVVDDDNIPYEFWGKQLLLGKQIEAYEYSCNDICFDPVGAAGYATLWHRGFPLRLLASRNYENKQKKYIKADIQADFWDDDPDIDAICRMMYAPQCRFDPAFFPMCSTKISPFNSQNTFLTKDVLKHYFLFPFVGRMDDIWASFYVQSLGFKVVYGKASVYQQRNEHHLENDMKQEYLGYENNHDLIQSISKDPDSIIQFLPPKSIHAWRCYQTSIKAYL